MKKTSAETIVLREERTDEFFLYIYELIHREGRQTADWRLPLYSVRISLTDKYGKTCTKEAVDIFTDKERAVSFFDRLVRNLATPIDLGYVVEDEIRI